MVDLNTPRLPAPRLAVAIVAWQALPAIIPEVGRNVGGLETAAWRLAKTLAAQGVGSPQIIVRSPSVASEVVIDGVRVTPHPEPREYVRREFASCVEWGDRLRLHRISPKLLWQIPYLAVTWPWRQKDPPPMKPDPRLRSYTPDVWIALGASRESAAVMATAIEQKKPSLLLIQSNADLDPRYVSQPDFRSAYGELADHCRFAVENASHVICQTVTQQRLLRQHFDRDGILLRNAIDPEPWRAAARKPGDYVLWIGRYDKFHKRPQLSVEIARLCPEIPFQMVVNESDDQVRREIQANHPENVRLVDYVPANEMAAVFGAARIFLSTGNADYEGFPTVLLQAVAAEKPIVSLDDFDGFISQSDSGIVCGNDLRRAAEAIRRYWNRPDERDPSTATEFLRQNYTVEATTHQLIEILGRL